MDQNGSAVSAIFTKAKTAKKGGDYNSSLPPKEKVKKRGVLGKAWSFVLNNFDDGSKSELITWAESAGVNGVIATEVGASGTPHLQCGFEWKTRVRPMEACPVKGGHWGDGNGKPHNPKSPIGNLWDYCTKDGNYTVVGNVELKYMTDLPDLYVWQKNILKELEKPPDNRTVWWYYGEGGDGKTQFQKYVCCRNPDALVLAGKGSDMKNGIMEWMENGKPYPKIIFINVPRSSMKYLSYTGLEEVKDAFFYSGKYKGGMVNEASPHVFIFANGLPAPTTQTEGLSVDKWKVRRIWEYQWLHGDDLSNLW